MSNIRIRVAEKKDVPQILQFVKDLAIYERAENEVIASEQDIHDSLFAANAIIHGLICEKNNKPIGFAVYFFNYSTWLGRSGLYLEDLYVPPAERGAGAGKALFKYLANVAVDRGCGRFEWSVLDWNEPAIKFYESCGASAMSEWVGYRLSGEKLIAFSES